MKRTYVTLIVLVILVVGAVLIFGKGKMAQAPVAETTTTPQTSGSTVTNPPAANTTNTATPPTTAPVKEFTVVGQNFSFTPSTITVNKGDKVKITFSNVNGFHDFRIDEFGAATPKTQSPATEVLEFTASKAGSFEYYCSVGSHRMMGMKGTLIVK